MPMNDFLQVVNRDRSSKLFNFFLENRGFCVSLHFLATDEHINGQTDR